MTHSTSSGHERGNAAIGCRGCGRWVEVFLGLPAQDGVIPVVSTNHDAIGDHAKASPRCIGSGVYVTGGPADAHHYAHLKPVTIMGGVR